MATQTDAHVRRALVGAPHVHADIPATDRHKSVGGRAPLNHTGQTAGRVGAGSDSPDKGPGGGHGAPVARENALTPSTGSAIIRLVSQ